MGGGNPRQAERVVGPSTIPHPRSDMNPLISRIAALALVLPGALSPLGAPAPSSPGDEEDAQALLEKAEGRAADGRYKDARRIYEQIAKKHPDTRAGVVAERRSRPSAYLGWADVVRSGPSSNRVDVVLMGEGYQLDEQKGFDKLAEDIPPVFERQGTFREYYSYFNFLRTTLVSAQNGVDGYGREYDTALGGYTTGTYAGHVGIDGGLVRGMLAELPEHDSQAIVFVRNGVMGTGGGGIATIGGRGIRTVIHEFGHSFGHLSDEYSSETHPRGSVRDGVNVASSPDPEKAPWAHWIEARVPGIGMYEGASGQVRGAWKPTASGCVMLSGEFFCRVCREQLVKRIYAHVDPIDHCTPEATDLASDEALILRDEPLEFQVQVMRPDSHALEVSWWVIPLERAPRAAPEVKIGRRDRDETRSRPARQRGDRRDRGPLPNIAQKPVHTSRNNRRGDHELRLKRSDIDEPGRYRVICRAKDTTRLRGEKWPWVLRDEDGVLESERGWWVMVPAED